MQSCKSFTKTAKSRRALVSDVFSQTVTNSAQVLQHSSVLCGFEARIPSLTSASASEQNARQRYKSMAANAVFCATADNAQFSLPAANRPFRRRMLLSLVSRPSSRYDDACSRRGLQGHLLLEGPLDLAVPEVPAQDYTSLLVHTEATKAAGLTKAISSNSGRL